MLPELVRTEADYERLPLAAKVRYLADFNLHGHAIDELLHPIAREIEQLEARLAAAESTLQEL